MSDRFWVGSGSANTWAATAPTNWSATSGGANNASVPGVSDLAIFDSNSGTGNSIISASTTVQGLDCTGGTGDYAGTITHNHSVTLTINTGAASSVRFSAGMTYTPATNASLTTLTHTSGTANITSAGKSFGSLTINGAGGTTTLIDALRVDVAATSALTVTSGIFDAGTNTCAVTARQVTFSGTLTRSVILGGTVTIGGGGNNANVWSAATTTNLTFTKNAANIVIVAAPSGVTGIRFDPGGLTYNNLTLETTANLITLLFNGTCAVANLGAGTGWSIVVASGATITVANAFALAGTQAKPFGLFTSSYNGVATISVASGTCTLDWGALWGITATGGATFNATNTVEFSAVTGWNVTPPAAGGGGMPMVGSGMAGAGNA